MPDHPNADLVKILYDAWAQGDPTAFVDACTADSVLHVSGNHQLTGDHVGPAGILALLQRLQETDGDFCMTYEDAFAKDDHVLVLTSCSATRDGRSFSWRVFDIFRIENAKIGDFWTFASPQSVADEFWS